MASSNFGAGPSVTKIKRENVEPIEVSIPVAPKNLRRAEPGPVISEKTHTIVPRRPSRMPDISEPDHYMLNKPAPIPFNLPKDAKLAPRETVPVIPDDPKLALKEFEKEAATLKEEVAALKWLAKRKEQEWNTIVGLLKKKEETWLKVKKQADLIMTDGGLTFQKLCVNLRQNVDKPIQLPVKPEVITTSPVSSSPATSAPGTSSNGTGPRKILIPVNRPLNPETIKMLGTQGMIKTTGVTPDGKRILVVKKSMVSGHAPTKSVIVKNKGQILVAKQPAAATAASPAIVSTASLATTAKQLAGSEPAVTRVRLKLCQNCKEKPPKFECAGCAAMWYCSRECQEKHWDEHADHCGSAAKSSTSTIKVKEEPPDVDDEI